MLGHAESVGRRIPTQGSHRPDVRGPHKHPHTAQSLRVPAEPGHAGGGGTHRGPASVAPRGRLPPGHCCWPTAPWLVAPGPAVPPSAGTGTEQRSHPPDGSRGGQGLPRGLGAAPGPHRPCVAGLLQCLARGPLGGLHGPQDAAVGVGGLHGPLDEAVLVDSANDAVGEAGQGPGLCDRGWHGSGPARGPPTLTAVRPSCPAPAGTMASPSGNPPAASCLLKASTALRGLSRGAPPRAPHLERLWASWSSRHAWASAASTRSTFPLAGKKARIFSSSGVRAPSRLAARCSDSWGGRASVEPPSRPLTRSPYPGSQGPRSACKAASSHTYCAAPGETRSPPWPGPRPAGALRPRPGCRWLPAGWPSEWHCPGTAPASGAGSVEK